MKLESLAPSFLDAFNAEDQPHDPVFDGHRFALARKRREYNPRITAEMIAEQA